MDPVQENRDFQDCAEALTAALCSMVGDNYRLREWTGGQGATIDLPMGGAISLWYHQGRISIRGELPNDEQDRPQRTERLRSFKITSRMSLIKRRVCDAIEVYLPQLRAEEQRKAEREAQAKKERAAVQQILDAFPFPLTRKPRYADHDPRHGDEREIYIDHDRMSFGYVSKVEVTGGYLVPGDVSVNMDIRVTPDQAIRILKELFNGPAD